MRSRAELQLAAHLGFWVTTPGNRKVELLDIKRLQDAIRTRVRTTRPATQQECEMWDHMVGLAEMLEAQGGYNGGTADLKGMPAEEARNPLGDKKTEPLGNEPCD